MILNECLSSFFSVFNAVVAAFWFYFYFVYFVSLEVLESGFHHRCEECNLQLMGRSSSD